MELKEQYRRFRAWQKEPRQFALKSQETHRCACCEHEFIGNYCPICGQKANDGRITWLSLWKNVTMLWGMDSRSMPYSLWQLMWRPGYFIGEYISGRRQVSYPPVKMLFIIAVFYVVIKQLVHFDPVDIEISNEGIFGATSNWLRENPGWAVMTLTIFFSIPTWFFFRFAPLHSRHSFPEGLFIQLFMASIMLICILIQKFIPPLLILIPIYYYITYRQLFGYRFWGTFWRLALASLVWSLVIIFLVTIAMYSSDSSTGSVNIIHIIYITLFFLIIIAVLLFIGYWISKCTAKRTNH